jgi:2-polyprenyl-3-methyl-5-hydroxy-6-metoxy-1,4-benzoquinol methylase
MDNGRSAAVIEDFDAIAALPDAWDHNTAYQRLLLERIGRRGGRALDIGCGTGEFARLLRGRCDRVAGIDVSPRMIEEARLRNGAEGIEYSVEAVEDYLAGREGEFSVIASIAALHHMEAEKVLALCARSLAPGGILLVLDLFKDESLGDYLYSGLSAILNPAIRLAKTGRARQPAAEIAAWRRHGAKDRYDGLAAIRGAAARALGGGFELRRLLFWRYALIYEKP